MSVKGAEGGTEDKEEAARRGSSRLQRGGRWEVIAVMACKLRACVCGEAKMNTKAGPLEVRASEARWEGRTEGPEKGSFSPLLPDRCCRQPWAQRVTKLQRGLRVIIPPSSGLSSQDHRAWALPASSAWAPASFSRSLSWRSESRGVTPCSCGS